MRSYDILSTVFLLHTVTYHVHIPRVSTKNLPLLYNGVWLSIVQLCYNVLSDSC